MRESVTYDIERYECGNIEKVEDEIVAEYQLDLHVNGERLVRFLCTPKSIKSLCIGFLNSEDLINKLDDIEGFRFDESRGAAFVKIKSSGEAAFKSARADIVGTSKGMVSDNLYEDRIKFSMKKTESMVSEIDFSELLRTVSKFTEMSELFRNTGGVHSCGAGSFEDIEVFEEDIGRHNALDKVVGRCIQEGMDRSGKILFLSGRVSSEMLMKAMQGGFSMIVSKSAPTNLAVDMAREKGIFLCGFARGEKLNIYSVFPSVEA